MQYEIPYFKLFKLALIISPLFGILVAAPVFALNGIELSQLFRRFLEMSSLMLLFWIVNILLLKLFEKFTFRARHWLRYAASILICALLLYFIFKLFTPGLIHVVKEGMPPLPPLRPPPRPPLFMPLIPSLTTNVLVIVLLELVVLKYREQKIETENAALRIVNLEARHSQLKQQLHPHFLFNSLNILKSLIKKSPGQAEEYLIKLSELLRFSIYSGKQAVVTLAEELELSVHYLNMQKVRFNDALEVSINVPPSMKQNCYVPVYSIQLLIENAIKHNTLTAQQPLHITICGNEENNTVTVMNNMQTRLTVEDESGVGLSNLTERYRLLGNKPVHISKESGQFRVTINVLENENSNS